MVSSEVMVSNSSRKLVTFDIASELGFLGMLNISTDGEILEWSFSKDVYKDEGYRH